MSAEKISVGKTGIETYSISNDNGIKAEIITYGARLHRLFVPDKKGNPVDILAGFDTAEGYKGENPYFNAVIGRVANRIGNAEFTLNGKYYKLAENDGKNCLHGGKEGFDRKIFTANLPCNKPNTVELSYVSPDGEEGFPGKLSLTVSYTLTNDNALKITYKAVSDADTIFNPTNHAYFNLDGDFISVLNHELFIDSDTITVSDENLICTGETVNVKNTPFDFTVPKPIGKDIKIPHVYFDNARGGYDFNYVLDKSRNKKLPVAYALSHKTGIKMEVYTDCPCIQLYTGNFLDGTLPCRRSCGYQSTLCLETQSFPNACNVSSFPSTVLKKGEEFFSETAYIFSIEK